MGGQSTTSQTTNQTQDGTQNQTQAQQQYGSTGQSQASQTNPYAASVPTINSIISQLNPLISNSGLTSGQTGAINTLESNASGGNPYAPAIGQYATSLLSGGGANNQAGAVQSGLDTYRSQLTPYANGSMIGNNPYLTGQLSQIQTDVTNQQNGAAAAAGRDFSGGNAMAIARGVAAGQAPVLANQYNQDVSNQMNAAGALYGAQNTTSGQLSGMQQTYNANQGQGVTAAGQALDATNYSANATLAAEAQRTGIPIQQLGLLAQIGFPIAGLGSSSTGTSAGNTSQNSNATASGATHGQMFGQTNGTANMSGAQQFQTIAQGISSLLGNFGTGKAFGSIN